MTLQAFAAKQDVGKRVMAFDVDIANVFIIRSALTL
jgi:hypothetical protein